MEDKKKAQRFILGYNDGYLLGRFEPDLLKQIMNSPQTDNAYFDGLVCGKKMQERELFLENLKKSQEIRQENLNKPRLK